MDINKVKELVQQEKDTELQDYLQGLSKPTPEGIREFAQTEEGKKALQPVLDSYFTKGLETWKQNNLDKIVEEEVSKRYPEETEEQKRLKKLEKDLADERQHRTREQLRNKAITEATQKGLPTDIVDHLVGQDEQTTMDNLSKFEQVWQNKIQEQVEQRFKGSGHDPHKTGNDTGTFTRESLSKMSRDEINANWDTISKQMEEGKL